MNKLIFGMIVFVAVGTLSGCGKSEESSAPKSSAPEMVSNEQDVTLIYLTRLDAAEIDRLSDGSPHGCSNNVKGVATNKKLSPQEALEELFAYKDYSKEEGLYNVFETSSDLKIENLLIQNDFAIVALSEDMRLDKMFNSECAYTQINKTLTQFDNIDGVDVFVGDKELSAYVSEKGDDSINP